ncbi:ComF family protein [Paenibacillus azoreducens]|uniref:ComF family protein n=1 Tax=Paenibacillus azoreducens TaxID=116718 RepID=A0A919YFV0_9BACL|nr:ComF family protein [Paenibacillus azoreducens]GIO48893.1 hypothetical protein J34TS1_36580 [Paenibacillus azoreducens]
MNSIPSFFTGLIRELLAPPGDVCLTCGGKTRLTREWPGICRRCAEGIPWIEHPRCLCCGRAIGCPDCLRPEAQQRFFVMNRSAVRYNEVMREWLAQYKYRGHERYAALLVKMLGQALTGMQREISMATLGTAARTSAESHRLKLLNQSRLWRPDVVTYVPVSAERLTERGFNQAQVLAEGIGKAFRLPVAPLLVRSEHTSKQSFKTRQERIESMKHAFDIHMDGFRLLNRLRTAELKSNSSRLREMALHDSGSGQPHPLTPGVNKTPQILLIDDIYTTGSTINTCAGVIQAGARHYFGIVPDIYSLTWARS